MCKCNHAEPEYGISVWFKFNSSSHDWQQGFEAANKGERRDQGKSTQWLEGFDFERNNRLKRG